ncbi:SDR family NAD(P)-dependent oxidoreductase [Mycolicibacterium hodleri]|jgi:NAD(P)-dependent dehydrogenase (short-subunit alcohol dehydrogenase family)|uniref:SDR family oxidoreductase n=1 Tax=Mycolicibacterium hodleri TaxID=49897 RepID=A0A502EDL4_9MYCO|nr:SDR family oxidoreductase [Mycolicibacterium hodleri]TPG35062.1 SDR family oxidoreductase [Mycolicibacterium hodleri]
MSSLDGKIALVTGASAGIGLAVAQRLVDEGAFVYLTGRRTTELEKAHAAIGHDVRAVRGDIADLADLDRLYDTIRAEKGRLDIVVANAGTIDLADGADVTPEHFDTLFGTNARGTYFTVQKALSLMTNGGAIVLMSSGMNVKGFPSYGVYAATKAAIRSFGRTWAAELIDRGIRVNVLSPGVIDTPILGKQFATEAELAEGTDGFTSIIPMGRLGRSDEIASGVYYLVSDQSSYTTGFDLVVDGGIVEI